MQLESPKTTVQKSQKATFDYLTVLENYKNILPDSLEEFSVRENSFKFGLKGMPAIRLAIDKKQKFDLVKLKATSDKLPVFLNCTIENLSDTQSEVQLHFEGDINPMMALMLKKPLQNLLDTLAENLGKLK